jgi:hypothetical protein
LRLSRLGFTEMTLCMAYISPTSSEPQAPINPCQVHLYSTQLGRGLCTMQRKARAAPKPDEDDDYNSIGIGNRVPSVYANLSCNDRMVP